MEKSPRIWCWCGWHQLRRQECRQYRRGRAWKRGGSASWGGRGADRCLQRHRGQPPYAHTMPRTITPAEELVVVVGRRSDGFPDGRPHLASGIFYLGIVTQWWWVESFEEFLSAFLGRMSLLTCLVTMSQPLWIKMTERRTFDSLEKVLILLFFFWPVTLLLEASHYKVNIYLI